MLSFTVLKETGTLSLERQVVDPDCKARIREWTKHSISFDALLSISYLTVFIRFSCILFRELYTFYDINQICIYLQVNREWWARVNYLYMKLYLLCFASQPFLHADP